MKLKILFAYPISLEVSIFCSFIATGEVNCYYFNLTHLTCSDKLRYGAKGNLEITPRRAFVRNLHSDGRCVQF